MKKIIFLFIPLVLIFLCSCEAKKRTSPQDIVLNTDYNETVAAYSGRLYRITITTAGSYNVTISNCASDLGFTVWPYSSEVTYFEEETNVHSDNSDETWTKTLEPGIYWILVDEWTDTDSSFTLRVSGPL